MKNIITRILTLLATVFCLAAEADAQLAMDAPKRELRAVWLTTINGLDWPDTKATSPAGIERQKQELRNILDKLKAANFNAVIFQTRIRGTVVYPSQIEPWDGCLTGRFGQAPGYDPLAFAVEECHRRGMQIHAWVVAVPGNKSAQIKALGAQALGKRVPQLVIKTNEGNMLDPGQPGTADYIASICEEIVRGYDIDGLNFDYLRYPEKEISFSDGATYRRYANAGQSLANWRRENINRLVETIHHRVKAIKPWVALSCSPVGKYADTRRYPAGGWNALNAVSQDAKLWLREGWMDILMPMQYFRGRHYYPFLLDWQEDAAGRTIASGLGVYQIDRQQQNWPLSEMESQISYCRRYGVGGQVFFRSRFVTDNTKGIYNLLRYNLYRTQALPPAIDSKRSAPPAPVNARIEETPNGYTLKWEAAEACRYVLYRSSTYPVDTEDANNIYKVGLTEPQFTISLPLLEGWLPYYAVTAIDRYGHESAPLEINKERKMRTFAPLEINKEKKISTLKR
jgi:uncharacterized lipoprotein YddW (UPF0748 family)